MQNLKISMITTTFFFDAEAGKFYSCYFYDIVEY